MLLRQLRKGHVEGDAEGRRERVERMPDERAIAGAPGRDGAVEQRPRRVRHQALRIEVPRGAQALTRRARAVRRVEREGARRHLRDAHAAGDARQAPGEQPIATVERVDDHNLVGECQRGLDRLGQPPFDARAHDHAVDHDIDGVVAPAFERDLVLERAELAVDACAREAAGLQRVELLPELPLAAADHRREDVDARVLCVREHELHDPLERLGCDLEAAPGTMRDADVREEQAQVVVDLGHRPDGRARVGSRGLLLDGNGRRESLDQVDVGFLHLLEELARVRRQRLDIAPLPLRVNRVESERRLAGPRQPCDDDEPLARQVDVDIAEVVNARAPHRNPVMRHVGSEPHDEARPVTHGWVVQCALKRAIVPEHAGENPGSQARCAATWGVPVQTRPPLCSRLCQNP